MKQLLFLLLMAPLSCVSEGGKHNNAWNNDNTQTYVEPKPYWHTLTGRVWSPGADLGETHKDNRFPINDAVIAAYTTIPESPTERFYCMECLEIPNSVPSTRSAIDGSFSLNLLPDKEYYILVQKGQFRRITHFVTGPAGETTDLEPFSDYAPRDPLATLPHTHDPDRLMFKPRLLFIVGRGEYDLHVPFMAMGMKRNRDFEVVLDKNAELIAANTSELKKYGIIVVSCGDEAHFLTKPRVREAIREYIRDGGRLFVDDFAYDWVEQPFPDFLSFSVDYTLDHQTGNCAEGEAPPEVVGQCVNYSCYTAEGRATDPVLEEWIHSVSGSSTSLSLKYGCNMLYNLGPGLQGECPDPEDFRCQNGLLYDYPKVWLEGKWPGNFTVARPITVSFPYYCGKVLYTTLHTHAGDETSVRGYKLLLQEKIMLQLLLEIQTCVGPSVVE